MWDFSQPYRTEVWYNEVKDTPLSMPLCIPSYNRPDAPVFSSPIIQSLGKDNIFVFIRNDPEQQEKYALVADKVTLVTLPDWVTEIGTTREAIVQWGISQGYRNLVMVDDRAKNLFVLIPALTRNNKLTLKVAPWSTPLTTLKIWEYLQQLYNATISYAVFHENSWYPENIDKTPSLSGYTEAICINLKDFQKFDIHYKCTYEWGIEDIRILWLVMTKRLPVFQFTDIAYKEIPPEKMPQNTGSGFSYKQNHTSFISRKERMEKLMEVFVTKTLERKWGEPLDGFRYTTLKDGQRQLNFEWKKYWRNKIYGENAAEKSVIPI